MKIHIAGIYGSGKSTLAHKLSKQLNIQVYELDTIKYKRKFDQIRPLKKRKELLKKITNKKYWITEGAWSTYATDSFKKADITIIMKVSLTKLYVRIIKRFIKRKCSKTKQYNNNIKTTIKLLKQVNNYFYKKNNYLSQEKYEQLANKHIIITEKDSFESILHRITTQN